MQPLEPSPASPAAMRETIDQVRALARRTTNKVCLQPAWVAYLFEHVARLGVIAQVPTKSFADLEAKIAWCREQIRPDVFNAYVAQVLRPSEVLPLVDEVDALESALTTMLGIDVDGLYVRLYVVTAGSPDSPCTPAA